MDWIQDNKEWFFSGLGVFLVGLLFTVIRKRRNRKNINMKQKSGSDSTNIQIGRDYNGK